MEVIFYLLAAKSVFRFGELRNNKELMHTEYILLGTFLSFTIAVVVGLVAKWALTVLIIWWEGELPAAQWLNPSSEKHESKREVKVRC